MTRAEFISYVLVKVDELTPFEEELVISSGNDGVMPIREYINSIADETAREHYHLSPLDKIGSANIDDFATISVNGTQLELTKVADYIKIFYLKHSSWNRPITKIITKDDPKYKLQYNTYSKGGTSKPEAIEEGTKVICFSVASGAPTTGTYQYVKYTAPELSNVQTIDLISTLCAHKVLAIMNKVEQSKTLLSLYQRYLDA